MRALPGLAGCVLALFISLPAFAATVAFKDLSAQQIAALDASQQRLGEFYRALQILDARRARGKLLKQDYRRQQHELVGFIANEAEFQNAILHKEGTDGFVLSSEQLDKLQEGCETALAIVGRLGLEALTLIR
jgi:ABC-type uncharacterized transport system fused permease/ATPase subunit